MQLHTYNALPVAKFFIAIRLLQLFTFTLLIGITAYFITTISSSPTSTSTTSFSTLTTTTTTGPPSKTILILTLTSLSALYTLLTLPFFIAGTSRGLLAMCGLDTIWLIAYSVASVLVGRKIEGVECMRIPNLTVAAGGSGEGGWTGTGQSTLQGWTEASRFSCWVGKGAWGLCLGACVLWTTTVLVAPALFAKARRGGKGGAGA